MCFKWVLSGKRERQRSLASDPLSERRLSRGKGQHAQPVQSVRSALAGVSAPVRKAEFAETFATTATDGTGPFDDVGTGVLPAAEAVLLPTIELPAVCVATGKS
jgi:hypothetical protein